MKSYIWENNAGRCLIEWTKLGVSRFRFGFRSKSEALQYMSVGAQNTAPAHIPDFVKDAAAQLDEYFAGVPLVFSVKLDFGTATAFQKKVWAATAMIPYGTTSSYGDVARAADAAGGARAAGNALNSNPVPVIVPCHRVTKADGTTGGYATGPDVKRALLELEAGSRADFSTLNIMR